MILKSLADYARREGLVDDYQPLEVRWLVRIGQGGAYLGMTSTLGGEEGPRARGKRFDVPKHPVRTGTNPPPYFLVDKPEYVFGVPELTPKKSREECESRGERRRQLFADVVRQAAQTTKDEALLAVAAFLDTRRRPPLPPELGAGDLIAFIYDPDGNALVTDRPAVREYWLSTQKTAEESAAPCLVCGETRAVTSIHPHVPRVPGNPSPIPVVSFNASGFESYGLSGNENAAVCGPCAEAYGTALRRLLDPAYPAPKTREPLPVRTARLSANSGVVFWSSSKDAQAIEDILAGVARGDDEEAVRAAYEGVWRGRPIMVNDSSRVYALVLSGAKGRATIHGYHETTVRDAMQNLRRHFEDTRIVPQYREGSEHSPLREILRALVAQGKDENIPPRLCEALLGAALTGITYPRTLLSLAIERIRTDHRASAARLAGIKAYLNRARRRDPALASRIPEALPMLDTSCCAVAYRLGRLLALLEWLQKDAVGVERLVERFYGRASSSPAVVFGQLLRGARPHVAKLGGKGVAHERRIQEVLDGLDPENAFPSTLTLEEQGLFALGYYHQKADRYRPRETRQSPHTTEGGQ